ncbi:hypothetical protein FD428_05440 [Citrobacter sp. TBCP-5362]|uniref:hypothetical protein n=1 Tax=Citrobacter TaxID=544 RepID=UPI000E1628CE|nr:MULTISPECIES: hypothetical protein [Citrobacter]MBJ9174141.1 hypothetical protein [Citrobacter koseri]QCQ70473.1 hypothetical protein FD428_05440 [Citrobacter sp. TBCP-5362]WQD98654.1 hypothetical protein U0009_05390 [Citrobacter koseri]SUX84367.1 Uncharacterised protein [Citrobacter koseri]HEM6674181.1 hypothetical protein [Citrobacter koseri]
MTKFSETLIHQDVRFLNVRTLLDRVDSGRLDAKPPYGSMPALSIAIRSQMIESLILGLSTETFWAEQDGLGRTMLLSGFEMVSAIAAFAWGRFALKDLRVLKHLEGLSFDNIDYADRRQFEQMELIFITISYDSNPLLKCMLVEKINRPRHGSNAAQFARNIIFPACAEKILDLATYCLERHDFSGLPAEKNMNRLLLRMQTDLFYGLLICFVKSHWWDISGHHDLGHDAFSRSRALERLYSHDIAPSDDLDYALNKLAMMLDEGNWEAQQAFNNIVDSVRLILNARTFGARTVGKNYITRIKHSDPDEYSLLDYLYENFTGRVPPLNLTRSMTIHDLAGIP